MKNTTLNSHLPNTHLRVYRGPAEAPESVTSDEDTVTVAVGEALPLIADAIASERTWLTDFEHDDITISPKCCPPTSISAARRRNTSFPRSACHFL